MKKAKKSAKVRRKNAKKKFPKVKKGVKTDYRRIRSTLQTGDRKAEGRHPTTFRFRITKQQPSQTH